MIQFDLDPARSIVHLRPTGPLAAADFASLTRAVDAHIEAAGGLAGLVIELDSFPGWESLGGLVAHVRFVRDHHRLIRKVAVVTDSELGAVAEKLASHFVAAQIRRFPPGDAEAALDWIAGTA